MVYATRYMDPATVRFTNVDPLVENYFSWSPYVYVGNNLMRLVNPGGKLTIISKGLSLPP